MLKNYPIFDWSSVPEWKRGYLAGLIDGEGSIIIPKKKNLRVGIYIANTHVGVLEWCLRNFPFGNLRLVKRKQRYSSDGKIKHDICYQFYSQGTRNVYMILVGLLPYLIIKKEKAEECVGFLENKYGEELR